MDIKIQIAGINVEQRIEDRMYNASTLLNEWNKTSVHKRRILEFLKNDSVKSIINQLISLLNTDKDMIVRSEKHTYTKGRPSSDVYMNPYLFAEFLSWLMPDKKIHFLCRIYMRQRLQTDISAERSKLIDLLDMPDDINDIDSYINNRVFHKDEPNIRLSASNKSLMDIQTIYTAMNGAIAMKLLTQQELMNKVRNMTLI